MKSIAAIFAHLDDAEIWTGGTLKKHIDLGDNVQSYVFYELSDVRLKENSEASKMFGIKTTFCKTDAYNPPDLGRFLELLNPRPDIIITHWERDTHLEHRLVFDHCLLVAHHLKRYEKKYPIFLMSSTYNFTGIDQSFEPTIIIDVSDQMDFKKEAIGCYKSQKPVSLISDIDSQCRILGKTINRAYGEGFIEYPLFGVKRSLYRESLSSLL